MKTSIITVANQKGGVAKTTSAGNLGSSYALNGMKVLLIDLDYQGNLTSLLRITDKQAEKHSIAKVITEKSTLDQLIIGTEMENIDIVPSTRPLNKALDIITGEVNQFHFLKQFFEHDAINAYDVVIIDTHPSLDLFFKAALVASHYYLIPLTAEFDAFRGLAHQIDEAKKVSNLFNPMLTLLGALLTKFDKRNSTHVHMAAKIEAAGKETNFNVFKTRIPVSSAVAAASAASIPLNQYKKHLDVAISYQTLAGEILPLLKGQRTGRKPAPINTSRISSYEIEDTTEL